jgi:hypothetical protein
MSTSRFVSTKISTTTSTAPLEHGEIAGRDRVEHQPAEAGTGEDDLDEHGAAEQPPDTHAEAPPASGCRRSSARICR